MARSILCLAHVEVAVLHDGTSHQTPATATRQLDFVFASTGFAERVRVCALNEAHQWGPSDHCRVKIEVD